MKRVKITPFYSENAKEPLRSRTCGKATVLVRYENNVPDVLYVNYYEDDWRLYQDVCTLLSSRDKPFELLMIWRNELRSYKVVINWYKKHRVALDNELI